MDYLYSILEKILYIIIIMGTGILAKRRRWVSEQGERDITTLTMDFIWPCMIFSSVTTSLDAADVLANLWLPILSVAIHLVGLGLGLAVSRFMGYYGDRRRVFLFHAAMNNFLVMALPFAQSLFPGKGAALLAVANLGSMVCLWTMGVFLIAGNLGRRQTLKNIFSPGLVATLASILFVLTGVNRSIPGLITDVMRLVGQPTLFFGLFIAGTQIYKLGAKALKFDVWNILVGLLRNIVVPGLMLCLALALRGVVGDDALVIFLIVAVTPASVNSVTLAVKYNSAPNLAAEGVLFTHLLAIGTMLGYVALIEWLFL